MTETLSFPDWGSLGTRVLTDRIAELDRRADRRMMTQVELAEKRGCEKALAELAALAKARERIPEGRIDPLDVVRLQVEELDAAGLSRDCLNTADLQEIARRDAAC